MSRRLSTWLVLVRSFQLLGSFIPAAMNGWLLYYIFNNRLGPSNLMLVLEILAALIFVYSALSIFIIHTRERSRRTPWMVCSVCLDVVFCFVDVTTVSLLAYTGLPSNCSGLTTTTFTPGDKPDKPLRGYTTIRFSNEQDGHKGELDRFCGLERGFYFCALLIILSYMISIVLSVLRICELNYTRNSEIQHLLDEREEILKLELKIQEQEHQSHNSSPVPILAHMRPNPLASLPDDNHDEEAAISSPTAGYANDPLPRSIAGPSSTSMAVPSSSRLAGAGLAAIPESSSYHSTHPSASSSSSIPTSSIPIESAFLLSSTEMHANLAMITDGSRYSPGQAVDHNQLPPYSPGNQRTMAGHGLEDNDIRLSEYVKGETRAQDMKDTDGF